MIRISISIGGDSNTLAIIAGGIVEAFYGVPDEITNQLGDYLKPDLMKTVKDFRGCFSRCPVTTLCAILIKSSLCKTPDKMRNTSYAQNTNTLRPQSRYI